MRRSSTRQPAANPRPSATSEQATTHSQDGWAMESPVPMKGEGSRVGAPDGLPSESLWPAELAWVAAGSAEPAEPPAGAVAAPLPARATEPVVRAAAVTGSLEPLVRPPAVAPSVEPPADGAEFPGGEPPGGAMAAAL